MQPPWEIEVCEKAKTLARFQVPAHKLGPNDLASFLRPLVVRGRTNTIAEMMVFYVNRRRGAPNRLPFAEVQPCRNLKRGRVGYWCGDWDCYATAMKKIDKATAAWIRKEIRKNRAA
jgi:hypothetical protein